MKIGAITFTMEALVETLIVNEAIKNAQKQEKKREEDLIIDNSPHPCKILI